MQDTTKIIDKIKMMLPFLNEAQKRVYLATEALSLGRGGKTLLEKGIGVSHNTINNGIKELNSPNSAEVQGLRQRKEGGGRKKVVTSEIMERIKDFIEPHTRGEPETPLLWVSKSLRNIEGALEERGIKASYRIIGEALKREGFSLQANKKRHEGAAHPDRDAQFCHINERVKEYHSEGQPVISVDAKKRELVGNFQNAGREWHKKSSPEEVNAYDFLTGAKGVAIPYGVYDLGNNKGWVNIGITKDTAEFAVQSIRNWWYKMGIYYNNRANRLLITADGGGSNSSKGKLWKYELQKLANDTGMSIEVVHFPPGTSKWNKIEHRLFSYISKNWRGKPLVSYKVVIKYIASTKTSSGLDVECEIDPANYETGIVIKDKQMEQINLVKSNFHGEWNYTSTLSICQLIS
jgi:transposase